VRFFRLFFLLALDYNYPSFTALATPTRTLFAAKRFQSHVCIQHFLTYFNLSLNNRILVGGATATATIVDRCTGCGKDSLDMTTTLFQVFSPLGVGRIHGIVWSFI
jgi:hypothetical protein